MKLRRDVAAIPLRTGGETWSAIIGLITKNDSIDVSQLSAAAPLMASLLAEEHYSDHPLTLKGDGHRLVIYCSYGSDAIIQGDEVSKLDWNPTAKTWTLYVPCEPEALAWMSAVMEKRAPRIKLYKMGELPEELMEEQSSATPKLFQIDWNEAG